MVVAFFCRTFSSTSFGDALRVFCGICYTLSHRNANSFCPGQSADKEIQYKRYWKMLKNAHFFLLGIHKAYFFWLILARKSPLKVGRRSINDFSTRFSRQASSQRISTPGFSRITSQFRTFLHACLKRISSKGKISRVWRFHKIPIREYPHHCVAGTSRSSHCFAAVMRTIFCRLWSKTNSNNRKEW